MKNVTLTLDLDTGKQVLNTAAVNVLKKAQELAASLEKSGIEKAGAASEALDELISKVS